MFVGVLGVLVVAEGLTLLLFMSERVALVEDGAGLDEAGVGSVGFVEGRFVDEFEPDPVPDGL